MWKIDIVQEANNIINNNENQKEKICKLIKETDIKYEELNLDNISASEIYDIIIQHICDKTKYMDIFDLEDEKILKKIILYMAKNNHWCFVVTKEEEHCYYLLFEQNCRQQEYCSQWNEEMGDCDLYFEDDCQWAECSIMDDDADNIYWLVEDINKVFKNDIKEAIVSEYLPNAIYIYCKEYE